MNFSEALEFCRRGYKITLPEFWFREKLFIVYEVDPPRLMLIDDTGSNKQPRYLCHWCRDEEYEFVLSSEQLLSNEWYSVGD